MRKKLTFALLLVAAATALTGCSKERSCRCAVRNSSVVRIIDITSGTCDKLNVYTYHRSPTDSTVVDSILSSDYHYDIDSLFTK